MIHNVQPSTLQVDGRFNVKVTYIY